VGVGGSPVEVLGPAEGTVALGEAQWPTLPAFPPATIGLQLSGLVASLSLWGASDSTMGSMWQEVGTVSHRVARHPPSWRLGYRLKSQATEVPKRGDLHP
jgi:hypothetical protein